MTKEIKLGNRYVKYDLTIKKVKNVNIRIKSDLSVHVSASSRVPQKLIDEILQQKSDFIISALEKYEKKLSKTQNVENTDTNKDIVIIFGKIFPVSVMSGKKDNAEILENEILVTLKDVNEKSACQKAIEKALEHLLRDTVTDICKKAYPQFEQYTPHFPEIKFRRMKSRWGSCNYTKHILTFNYNLIHAPLDCVEYVVYHEFTHFIHPDHQKGFYLELSQHIPDYKNKKKQLASVIIR